jgi:probable F420-dependent oxidoreductase
VTRILVDRVVPPGDTLSALDAALLGVGTEAGPWDGLWVSEARHDPFLTLGFASEHTERLTLGTSIAVAFARSPMTLAHTAYDLQRLSRGRFVLGLGSQVRGHIERRFAMPWSSPAARMRDYVQALRAIWGSWRTGEPLDYRGEFYQHTLMTPFFAPPALVEPDPPICVAAVGPGMTRVAGEVADGVILHGFTTPRYIREVSTPALAEGRQQAGRREEDVTVSLMAFVVTGRTEVEMAIAAQAVREQVAFYASTPAYRPVMELHGWGDVADELSVLSRRGGDSWEIMNELIDDSMLREFAIVAEPGDVAEAIVNRYAGLIHRVSFYTPYAGADRMWEDIAHDLVIAQAIEPIRPTGASA